MQFFVLFLQTQEDKYGFLRQERHKSLYYWGIKMKSMEIRSKNVTILFNILGSNRELDPYSPKLCIASNDLKI